MDFAPRLIEWFPEATVLGFQLVQAAFPVSDAALQASEGGVTFDTAGTSREHHDNPPFSMPKKREGRGAMSGCIGIVRRESRISLERKSERR